MNILFYYFQTDDQRWRRSALQKMQQHFVRMGDRYYDLIQLPDHNKVLEIKVGYALFGPPQKSEGIGYEKREMEIITKTCEIIKCQTNKFSSNKIYFASIKIECTGLDFKNEFVATVIKIGRNECPCKCIYIDDHQRVYENWSDYLQSNKLPKCWMCIPRNGVYEGDDKNRVQVTFEKSNACSLMKSATKTGDMVAQISALGYGGITVAAWVGLVASTPILATTAVVGCGSAIYSGVRGIATILDRQKHSQSVGFNNMESAKAYLNIFAAPLVVLPSANFLINAYTAQNASFISRLFQSSSTVEEFLKLGQYLSSKSITLMVEFADIFSKWGKGVLPREAIIRIRATLLHYFHILVDVDTPLGQLGEQLIKILMSSAATSLLPKPVVAVLSLLVCKTTKDVITSLNLRGLIM